MLVFNFSLGCQRLFSFVMNPFDMRICSLFFLTVVLLFSCTKSEDVVEQNTGQNEDYPLIMMHGALGSGDTYATQAQRFVSNGYASDLIFAFDWNSLDQGGTPEIDLDLFVDQVLATSGKSQVVLIGHSAGGNLGYTYLEDENRAEKVARYVHVGSFVNASPAGPNGQIPTLNLYSLADEVVQGGDIPGAQNIALSDLDHYQIATSEESFIEMFKFLNNGQIPEHNILEDDNVILEGRVVDLGSNEMQEGITIEIFKIDANTGGRAVQDPVDILVTDSNGNWGPWEAEKGQRYEFVISSDDPDFKKLHYYREGFVKSDRLVYLRSFPPPGNPVSLLLGLLPESEDQSVFAIFASNQAVLNGRDELSFNSVELSTPALAAPDQTNIAFFIYDNGDMVSSGNQHLFFGTFPFLNGIDLYTSVENCQIIPISFNGVTLHAENWKSANQGYSIVVFN